jgi:hypothetical protein
VIALTGASFKLYDSSAGAVARQTTPAWRNAAARGIARRPAEAGRSFVTPLSPHRKDPVIARH